ncbi:MAG: fasciclin domain-containing protein, partial [Dysgonamonadaceae bacterium]|nr:fasciclin domain-containing protein [Dysgonamonadaceae bacterium]
GSFLAYDPGWNAYTASAVGGSFQTDMAVMFVPSDQALQAYFQDGAGRSLRERYGTVKDIPNEVVDKLIKNHMKPSFLSTLPSQFHTIIDDAQERMGIKRSDVEKVYLASNGVVYVTNRVYSPALYSSVMFPATINENMKIFNWAITQKEFDAYLLSMVNYYSFLLPTDNFTYIVPTSLKHDQPEAWKFRYDYPKNTVYASVHPYDINSGEIGDSASVITNTGLLADHLEDMLDYHIVVGNIEDGKEYHRTKGGGTIRVSRSGNQIQLAGGGDIEQNRVLTVSEIYDQTKETNGRGNGKTYVIEQPLQSPFRSVYEVLSTAEAFSEFFKLLQGNDDLWIGDDVRSRKYSIFYRDASQAGLDFNVRFLNTYHYTLYVPTNEEVLSAINRGLPTWDDVENATDQDERDALADKIIRFLRYHFQDNAVFLDKPAIAASYETATLNNETETFYKLYLDGSNYSLNITTEAGSKAKVKTNAGLFNIMARDFKFNTNTPATATQIETSSYIVIHQIDKCLYFE